MIISGITGLEENFWAQTCGFEVENIVSDPFLEIPGPIYAIYKAADDIPRRGTLRPTPQPALLRLFPESQVWKKICDPKRLGGGCKDAFIRQLQRGLTHFRRSTIRRP